MKSNKVIKKIISFVVSISLVVSSALSTSLVVFATSGGGSNDGSFTGGASGDWYANANDQDIIKISASKIYDGTSNDDMADMSIRYGELHNFPIFMMSGSGVSHADGYGSTDNDVVNNLKKEAVIWGPKVKYTTYEYYKGDIIKYNTGDHNYRSDSVYIEDCLSVVYKAYTNEYTNFKLSLVDVQCFWYFYTRMAKGVNEDNYDVGARKGSSALGEKLSDAITKRENGFNDKDKHSKMMQHGYEVALAVIYGINSTPIKNLTGDQFKSQSDLNFGGAWDNNYKSIIVDRMAAISYPGKSSKIAFTPYDYLYKYNEYYSYLTGNNNLAQEHATFLLDHTNLAGSGFSSIALTFGGQIKNGIIKDIGTAAIIYPKREQGKDTYIVRTGKDNNKYNRLYGGWGYFPLESSDPIDKKVVLDSPEETRIATEVTYNAYLTDKDKNVDFAEQAKFGANSHVMTDTVYYSDIYDISHLFKYGDNGIKDDKNYLTTTVDPSITLSAPVENTTYNLYSMQYQITNAGGENSSFNYSHSDQKTRTLMENNKPVKATAAELSNSTIYVRGSDINYAIKGEMKDGKRNYYVNGIWKPSEFRIRVQKDKGDALSLGKYTYGNNQIGTYEVYLYGSKAGEENKVFRLEYKDSNGSWKDATTEQIANYVKGTDYNFRLKNNSDGYSMSISKKKGANFGVYNAHDLVGNSLNVFFVRTPDDGNVAAFVCKKNGNEVKFTYCPLAIYRNLLVQIKADYIATFAEKLSNGTSNSNYTDTFKAVNVPAYLLAQNTSSDDFTKKTMYTMLDMYNTNHWGTLTHASFVTYADDGSTITLPVTTSGSEGNEYYGSISATFRNYAANVTLNSTFIKKGTSFSGKLRKVSYIDGISKDVPMFGNFNFRLNRDVITKVRAFDSNNTLKSGSTEVKKEDKIYWTKQKGTANYNNKIRSVVADSIEDNSGRYLVPAEGDIIAFGECNNANMTAYNDGHGGQKTGIAYDYFSGVNEYVGDYSGIGNTAASRSKYIENYFTKILTHYVKYDYISKAGTATAPTLAKWMDASMSGFNSGITPNTMNVSYIRKGFLRFGQVAITDGYAGAEELDSKAKRDAHRYKYYTVKNMLSIDGVDKGIRSAGMTSIETYTGLSKLLLNTGSTYDAREFTFTAPITQSSYDIPLNYSLNIKIGDNKDKQALETYYKKDDKTISMFYQYSEDEIDNGLYRFGGSDSSSWKYNKVSIGVYPEVRMWAEKNFTENSTKHKPSSASDYNYVATVGARRRYVPATTYTTLDFGSLDVGAQVIGTAVAYDTRAKKLAQSLGSADTQVLYSGTAVNGTISSKASGTITTYALEFRSNGVINSQDVKGEWGNSAYSSSNAASKAMKVVLDQFKVNSSTSMAIYNGSTLNKLPMDVASTVDGDLVADTMREGTTRYNVYIRGSQIYSVVIFTKVGTDYVEAIRYRFIDPDGTNVSTAKYTKLKDKDNIVFWYNINGSAIKVQNNKYMYNNVELTEKEKNNYLAIYNGSVAVTKATFTKLRKLLENMKLYGNNNVLANAFEYNTGDDLPNGLKNSTGGNKSYNEDCSVLQIREYKAAVTSGDSKSTFTEQIPINAGPKTPIDKNMYFSNGYKAFINASVEVVAKNDVKDATGSIVVAKDTVFASDVIKHKVKDSTTEVVVDNASKAKTAIPDFIIGDVPISEALSG